MEKKEARMHERAMHRSKQIHGAEFGSRDPRRDQERADFNMIHEDHAAIANLPERFQNREFPDDHRLSEHFGNLYD